MPNDPKRHRDSKAPVDPAVARKAGITSARYVHDNQLPADDLLTILGALGITDLARTRKARR